VASEGKAVKYDTQFYNYYHIHQGFELSRVFGLAMPLGSLSEIRNLFGDFYSAQGREEIKVSGYRPNVIIEAPHHTLNFHRSYLTPKDNSYMIGYWQSWRYVERIKPLLQKQLHFPAISDPALKYLLEETQNSYSVGIHIRRGDYVRSTRHPLLPMNYYDSAVRIIEQCVARPKYFILSDDPEWVSKNLSLPDMYVVAINRGINSYRDMQLMSACKALIIANSSFSWWGAWLNQNTNPLIIAPKTWFPRKHEIKGIWLPSWKVI
jgi:hypothetical protein